MSTTADKNKEQWLDLFQINSFKAYTDQNSITYKTKSGQTGAYHLGSQIPKGLLTFPLQRTLGPDVWNYSQSTEIQVQERAMCNGRK